MTKLTAIMPTFNRVTFLPEAIKSIQDQTFKDWELIVVDDGSIDSTKDLMEFFTREDKRIKYFRRKTNKGIAISRNEAVQKASTNIIVICDSDDIQMPKRFYEINRYFKKNPTVDIMYHKMLVCDETLRIIGKINNDPFKMSEMMEAQSIPQPALAYRKKVWKKIPYNKKLKYGEDWEWLIECGLAKMKFGSIKKVLVKYREHTEVDRIAKSKEVKAYDKKMIKRMRKRWDGKDY